MSFCDDSEEFEKKKKLNMNVKDEAKPSLQINFKEKILLTV